MGYFELNSTLDYKLDMFFVFIESKAFFCYFFVAQIENNMIRDQGNINDFRIGRILRF